MQFREPNCAQSHFARSANQSGLYRALRHWITQRALRQRDGHGWADGTDAGVFVAVAVTAGGVTSNTVHVTIQ